VTPLPASPKRLGSYGIDAPYLLFVPDGFLLWNLIDGLMHPRLLPFVAVGVLIASVGSGLYTSLRGKFDVWSRLLGSLGLQGDERILDLGCGRGAVLLLSARHLTTGHAIGVDIWNKDDQSGNSPAATRRNAAAEGVFDRVVLQTADMTALRFADNSFDVIVSNVAIHNITGAPQRDVAIDEAWRVLRPGGRLLIADIFGVDRYAKRLRLHGAPDVERRSLGWRMWWSGPWVRTMLVTATKRPPRLNSGSRSLRDYFAVRNCGPVTCTHSPPDDRQGAETLGGDGPYVLQAALACHDPARRAILTGRALQDSMTGCASLRPPLLATHAAPRSPPPPVRSDQPASHNSRRSPGRKRDCDPSCPHTR
jgi:arsenite methyltransferase